MCIRDRVPDGEAAEHQEEGDIQEVSQSGVINIITSIAAPSSSLALGRGLPFLEELGVIHGHKELLAGVGRVVPLFAPLGVLDGRLLDNVDLAAVLHGHPAVGGRAFFGGVSRGVLAGGSLGGLAGDVGVGLLLLGGAGSHRLSVD